jgi:hypothetical protein
VKDSFSEAVHKVIERGNVLMPSGDLSAKHLLHAYDEANASWIREQWRECPVAGNLGGQCWSEQHTQEIGQAGLHHISITDYRTPNHAVLLDGVHPVFGGDRTTPIQVRFGQPRITIRTARFCFIFSGLSGEANCPACLRDASMNAALD